MRLAGEFASGLVFAIPPRGVAVPEAMGYAAQGADRAGHTLAGFRNCALTNIVLLEPGERVVFKPSAGYERDTPSFLFLIGFSGRTPNVKPQ